MPTPKTVLTTEFDEDKIKETAKKIGYPLFMRTDHVSGKHEGLCFVNSEEELMPKLRSLIDFSIMVGCVPKAVVFRELLELDARFVAFFGLPIAVEVRWFIRNGNVQCWHFYWVEDAIRRPSCEDWRDKLKEMEEVAKAEVDEHRKLAEKVAKVMPGYWSVDFARTKKGEWICIDMALGEQSYHPSSCPYLSEKEREEMRRYEMAHRRS